jgi:hypothetical protein
MYQFYCTYARILPEVDLPPFTMPNHLSIQTANAVQTLPLAISGLKVKKLKEFGAEMKAQLYPEASTAEVVTIAIKPMTAHLNCRYVELPLEAGTKGVPKVFVSHCWGGKFSDLVSALASVLDDDDYVWIDIFAVLQHNHTQELR